MQDTGSSIDFNLYELNIAKAVDIRAGYFASKVTDSTVGLIKDTINEGIAGGESINDIAARLDKVYGFSKNFRAKTTAQTEVIGSTNEGQIDAYREADVKEKEWLTARDEKVRHSHLIDGQTVGISESFTTNDGNKLQFPGDRSTGAPAGDIINCRCTVAPITRS
jgi:uncharacterized protein with gpF-like domain